jgi:hypothetical protein
MMITFKQFLAEEEVLSTTRKSMLHLQQMKPIEFVTWAKSVEAEFGGVLKNISVSLKVDGLGARFGKDKAGKFFFEGSRTGAIFEPKAFSSYAKSKNAAPELIARAEHYDDIFDLLKSSALVKALPNDTKVICEIFYNPMATQEGSKLKFVTVKYDKSKLGDTMSVVPIDVVSASTGAQLAEKTQVLDALFAASTKNIKVIDAKLKAKSIDVRATLSSVFKLSDADLATLKSLKAADKPRKAELTALIQAAKDKLADYLLKHDSIEGKDKLGKEIEGLVFDIGGKSIKVTTQAFKDSKKKS